MLKKIIINKFKEFEGKLLANINPGRLNKRIKIPQKEFKIFFGTIFFD